METPAPRRDRHAELLDILGGTICAGGLPAGALVSIEELADRHGVSRSVVREALRVLASMGLVESTRGVGTRTLPPSAWNVADPAVIRWRLASPDRFAQLRSLAELRNALEPEAAGLAAERGSPEAVGELVALVARLWTAGERRQAEAFLEVDVLFHTRLLEASGNEMLAHFIPVVEEILRGRVRHDLTPDYPLQDAIEGHAAVARAIQRRDTDGARAASRALTSASLAESSHLWTETHPSTPPRVAPTSMVASDSVNGPGSWPGGAS